MEFLSRIFNNVTNSAKKPLQRIRLTEGNINQWAKFDQLLKDGKIKFDKLGRLRYLHGAPVGDLVLTRVNKDGTPIYQESAEEWFDVESQQASKFIWE